MGAPYLPAFFSGKMWEYADLHILTPETNPELAGISRELSHVSRPKNGREIWGTHRFF